MVFFVFLSITNQSLEEYTLLPRLRYRVKVPDDKNWGTVHEDGTVTGMVGEVASRRAHLAITLITITGKYIDRQTDGLINRCYNFGFVVKLNFHNICC